MSDRACARIVLKNTFLDIVEFCTEGVRVRRSRSADAFRCTGGGRDVIVDRQLYRLNAVFARAPSLEEASSVSYPFVVSTGDDGAATPGCMDAAVEACDKASDLGTGRSPKRRRPCKAKRDRMKRAMVVLEGRIEEDPDIFANGDFCLPADFERQPRARARSLARLAQVAADAYSRMARAR
mmetsp:Transcript_22135/g.63484  ORF Transcript_22135/g.63484 Transcript_22135/m.63484 type:complete len:181 (-) Transcript_22135:327-869(-)